MPSGEILKLVANFGLAGIVFIVWYFDQKAMNKILAQYREDMAEQRRMYESNVGLVKDYNSLAGDLKDVVVLNTQAWQKVNDDIMRNQFCPAVREATGGK